MYTSLHLINAVPFLGFKLVKEIKIIFSPGTLTGIVR
jgi:hypothetical protein